MAEAVVSFVVESLGDLLIQEAKFLWGVSGQVERLQDELRWMQCFLKDADSKQDKDERVRNWISEIKDLAYDAEDVIETFALKVASTNRSSSGGCIKNVLKRFACILKKGVTLYKVGSEINEIDTKISGLAARLKTYGITELKKGESSGSSEEMRGQLRRSYSHVIEHDVVGLEESIQVVVAQLKDEKRYRVVSICGMGGLGKTTLAKKIYRHNEIRSCFKYFAWAYISQQCQTRDVWERILISLLSPTKEERELIAKLRDDELSKQLYHVLQEKKCLVILDDIWSTQAWKSLKAAFPIQETSSKILLTTRKRDVASHVANRGFIYETRCLNDKDSWELFQKKALSGREDIRINSSMEELGHKMVSHCAGLPLAITVLGGLLATKHILDEWIVVHENIKSSLRIGEGLENDNLAVSEVLALSYDDLPYQLKPCFLYLGHFPEDFVIPSKKLIQMWVAEGFISVVQHQREGNETMEDIARRYLGELVRRFMVQVGERGSTGSIKTCCLHDLMRDMCLSKANNENFLEILEFRHGNETVDSFYPSRVMEVTSTGRLRRLAIILDRVVDAFVPSQYERNPQLRSLMYFNKKDCGVENWEQIKSVFNNFKLLRVLYLEGIGGDDLELPKEIGNLIHLRFLSLKDSDIVDLPSSIGNLVCLQTLHLQRQNSSIKIPNVLWKMEHLRHLYLPDNCGNRSDKLQLANLSNLQTLVNFPADKCDAKELISLANLRKLIISEGSCFKQFGEIFKIQSIKLNCLRSLSLIDNETNFENYTVDLGPIVSGCPLLYKLLVKGRIEELPEDHQFPPTLTKLTLEDSLLLADPIPTLEKLPNLRVLSLKHDSILGKAMDCSKNGFPQLKSLLLHGFPELEEWQVDEGAMPSLRRLEIDNCVYLETVPDGLKSITTLKELEISHMPRKFQKRLERGGKDFHKVQHVPSVVFQDCEGYGGDEELSSSSSE